MCQRQQLLLILKVFYNILFMVAIVAANVSPGPAPAPSFLPETNKWKEIETEDRCPNLNTTIRGCHYDLNSYNFTACLVSSTAPKELCVLIQNDGKIAVRLNITIADIGVSFPEIQISKHRAKKIGIPVNIEASPSIILNSEDVKCTISLALLPAGGGFHKLWSSLTPIHGAYFLLLVTILVGGALAYCKFWKTRHVEGVPYKELQMGQSDDSNSTIDIETALGRWDQGWDDDWGEDEMVKQPNRNPTCNNGLSSKNSTQDGWRKNWDD